MEAWKPCDLILTSRLKVRDRAQKLLFERHEESGSSMITFSGQILPTWPYQQWNISASSSGWYAPQEEGSGKARGEPAEVLAQQLRKVTQRKLVAYKRQDAAKGLRTAVRRATLSCSGLTSRRTHNSPVLTGLTTPWVTSAITPG